MISYKISAAKGMFFDRAEVTSRLSKVKKRVLSRFGAFVRTTAKQSIRRAPSKRKTAPGAKARKQRATTSNTSQPGKPPYSQTGLLKQHIYFSYDAGKDSVVIGPARLSKPNPDILPALEYGGASTTESRGVKRRINVRARPFMQPAFDKEQKQLPAMWANSIKP